jgi:hypothetical protein
VWPRSVGRVCVCNAPPVNTVNPLLLRVQIAPVANTRITTRLALRITVAAMPALRGTTAPHPPRKPYALPENTVLVGRLCVLVVQLVNTLLPPLVQLVSSVVKGTIKARQVQLYAMLRALVLLLLLRELP